MKLEEASVHFPKEVEVFFKPIFFAANVVSNARGFFVHTFILLT